MKHESLSKLFGKNNIEILKSKKVLVVGIGGVGSWAAELLARSGVGKIILLDNDKISACNINRQIHALEKNIGTKKVTELSKRLKEINSKIEITEVEKFYDSDNGKEILEKQSPDYVIDAIDSLKSKCHLIASCYELKIPIIVSGAAGGKKDPFKIELKDLNKSYNDSVLFRMRKRLRQNYNFPRGRCPFGILSVFSSEDITLNKNQIESTNMLDSDDRLGTFMGVTASIGIMMGSTVIQELIKEN